VKAKYRASAALDLVHGDLCGPISPTTPARRRFFLLLVDDATRYMWHTLITAKSDAASVRAHHGARSLEAKEHADALLGRGGHHCCVPAKQSPNHVTGGEDTV
jgi:hypothetical protein